MSTDQELFDAATSNEKPEAEMVSVGALEIADEPAAAPTRDDAGRFAARAEDAQLPTGEGTAPAGTDPKEPPPHRFREVSERARAAEARAQQLEQLLMQMGQGRQPEPAKTEAAPKPEIWDNPDEWVGQHLGNVTQQVTKVVETFSRRMAVKEYGAEKVSAAYDALNAAISNGTLNGNAVKAKLAESMDPYEDIMAWHGQQAAQQALSTVGNDLAAYNQKIISDYLASQKQPQGGAPAQAGGTVVKLPPNLNRMTSAASDGPGAGDVSDQELFHATTSRRR